MKILLTIFTLVFTLMFSSTSFAEWTEVGKSEDGTTFYVDFERIRKHDGYVYFWFLLDHKLDEYGDLSFKRYQQGDCDLFRYKVLQYVYHKQPMGRDVGEMSEPHNKDWRYPPPYSGDETTLKQVCRITEWGTARKTVHH